MDDDLDAIDFLKNPGNFRPFDQGLTELLEKVSFRGNLDDPMEKADFLLSKLRKIQSGIEKETVWFFHHVYYDRCFNCHHIEEAVFRFCFLHSIPYQEALQMIKTIDPSDAISSDDPRKPDPGYTRFVEERISHFQTTDELLAFLREHKQAFHAWNNSAYEAIQNLLSDITGTEQSRSIIDQLKRSLARKVHSGNSPALTADIPYIIRNNFPSKKVLSDILNESKVTTSKSYDSIRKTLILLDFYVFWVRIKLGLTDVNDYDSEELAQSTGTKQTHACINAAMNRSMPGIRMTGSSSVQRRVKNR